MMPDSDSEDDLPPGWEERATVDGSVYYVNHSTKNTQWTHPRTGKKKKVAGELPFGWEKVVEDSGKILYVDHENHRTTYTDPRLAFAEEEKDSPLGFRQRFDGTSTALQVLHGRDLSGKTAVVTGANCGIGIPISAENSTIFQDKISTPSSSLSHQKIVGYKNDRTTQGGQTGKRQNWQDKKSTENVNTFLGKKRARPTNSKKYDYATKNCDYTPVGERPKFEFSALFDCKQDYTTCPSNQNKRTNNSTSKRKEGKISKFEGRVEVFDSGTKKGQTGKKIKGVRDLRHNYKQKEHSSQSIQDQINDLKDRNKKLSEELFDMPQKEETNINKTYSSVEKKHNHLQDSLSARLSRELQIYADHRNSQRIKEGLFDLPQNDLTTSGQSQSYSSLERVENRLQSSHSSGFERQESHLENRNSKVREGLFDMPHKDGRQAFSTLSQNPNDVYQTLPLHFAKKGDKYFDQRGKMSKEELFDMPTRETADPRHSFLPITPYGNYIQQRDTSRMPPDDRTCFEKKNTRLQNISQSPVKGFYERDFAAPMQTYYPNKEDSEHFNLTSYLPKEPSENILVIVPINYPKEFMSDRNHVKRDIMHLLSRDFPTFQNKVSKGALIISCPTVYSKECLWSSINEHPQLQVKSLELEELESYFMTVEILLVEQYASEKVFQNRLQKCYPNSLNVGIWDILHSLNVKSVKSGRIYLAQVDRYSLQMIEQKFNWKVPYGDTWAEFSKGFETSRALARHGCHVVLACRSVTRASEAIERIRVERPQALCTAAPLDLRSLKSVKEFVNTLRGNPQFNRGIDILILNAGVFALPHSLTEDGLETTFQVNYLSQFYLTLLLEEMLAKAAPSRVVFVSSESHRFSTMNASNISEEWLSPKSAQFWSMMAYNDSKLCGVVVARELARRWVTRDICVFSCHPGNMVSSDLSRHWCPYRLLFALVRPFTKSVAQAASTQVFCATATELNDVSGLYFNNCCRCEPSKASQDPQLAARLWNISLDLISSHFSSLDIPDKYRHKR